MISRPEQQARAILARLGELYGIPHQGATLLPGTTNTVFRLPGVPLVARVAPPDADPVRLSLEVSFARELAKRDAPFARPAEAYGAQPLGEAGAWVTLWRYVDNNPAQQHDWEQVGKTLRGFQDAAEGVYERRNAPLGRFDELSVVARRLLSPRVRENTTPQEHTMLVGWHHYLVAAVSSAPSPLGYGALHGDVTFGNILNTVNGPVFVDSDNLCSGPREWDLLPIASAATAGRLSPYNYSRFCDGYGFDVRTWEGFEHYARAHALARLVFVLQFRHESDWAAAEAGSRMAWWAQGATLDKNPD